MVFLCSEIFFVFFPYKFSLYFKELIKTLCCRLWFAIFPCEFGLPFNGKALTHVCVLMPNRASNIGHFANGVASCEVSHHKITRPLR